MFIRHMTPVFVAAFLLISGPYPATAQTPDGEPPAFEGVCDEESGAAFGLCNAYCEAMDCDSEFAEASEKACQRVAANYTKLTGVEFLPCDDDGGFCDENTTLVFDGIDYAGTGNITGAFASCINVLSSDPDLNCSANATAICESGFSSFECGNCVFTFSDCGPCKGFMFNTATFIPCITNIFRNCR